MKVTFTLDEATIERLKQTAEWLGKPKSEVVRDAIRSYHSRSDRLSPRERDRLLRALDDYAAHAPKRSQAEVDRELADIKAARRSWGRS